MSNQLIDLFNSAATGFNRIVDFVKTLAGENSEMPLVQVLIISRVLFAVVMIGFIGYFFDRMKRSVFAMVSNAKPNVRKER
ncbi:MAG: hypothetical protein HOO93_06685 [Methyloglobulus sp.]|nr:hypothetical protein [Methyloglobulus sp.]